jgi:alanine racemase
MRPTWCDIDLAAVSHNVGRFVDLAAPAMVCAVVKADGYGHGSVAVARAAVDAGAQWVAVATVDEGAHLRDSGLRVPILLLSEPSPQEMVEVVGANLRPSVYTGEGLAAAAAAAAQAGSILPVHMKINTGMNRVGASMADVIDLATAIDDKPSLDLEGVWTHCAVADELGNPFTNVQLDRFDESLADLRAAGYTPRLRHAANSAATLYHPRSHYDMVRIGISVYGIAPAAGLADPVGLEPALTLRSRVSMVKTIAAGERVSYGLRWTAPAPSVIATVPIGYADGIRRRLGHVGGEVLIGGRRRPIAGTVTMDQLMVDCGDDDGVRAGDEVVLIGRQGDEMITANEIAAKLDTIGYEVVCDLESRVPRRYR